MDTYRWGETFFLAHGHLGGLKNLSSTWTPIGGLKILSSTWTPTWTPSGVENLAHGHLAGLKILSSTWTPRGVENFI